MQDFVSFLLMGHLLDWCFKIASVNLNPVAGRIVESAMEYNALRGDKSISRDKLAEINQLSYKFQIYFQYVLIKLLKPLV